MKRPGTKRDRIEALQALLLNREQLIKMSKKYPTEMSLRSFWTGYMSGWPGAGVLTVDETIDAVWNSL